MSGNSWQSPLQEGFRGICWGTRQRDIPWTWSDAGYPAACFVREDESLDVFGIVAEHITYTFRNSLLYGIRIDYTGCHQNAAMLRGALGETRPDTSIQHKDEWTRFWRTAQTSVHAALAQESDSRGFICLWARHRMFPDDAGRPDFVASPPECLNGPDLARPRSYVCYRASRPITIDGNLDEKAWRDAKWSDCFEDHQAPFAPPPWKTTRFKMLYDDEYLYFGAELQEENVYGTLTERDCVIYYDNDFEIFLDPTGDGVGYYEFEINPLNTVWDMFHETDYHRASALHTLYDITGLKHAVGVQGTLNSHHDTDTGWTVEVAWPMASLLERNDRVQLPIKDGQEWRANFSRVQYMHVYDQLTPRKLPESPCEDWAWQSTSTGDLHNPETWGRIVFSDRAAGTIEDSALEAPRGFHSIPEASQHHADGMIALPACEFVMGPDPTDLRRSPAHEVQVDTFEIDRYPITVDQYARFLNESQMHQHFDTRMRIPNLCGILPSGEGTYDVVSGREEYPVVFVTLEGAAAYAAHVGKSLPTEAQWERAARGVEARTYAWGDAVIRPGLANYDYHYGGTTPIGRFPDGATPEGIFDMTGNVKEYTISKFEPYPGGDPMIYLGMREPFIHDHTVFNVVRGGSWTKQSSCMAAAYRDSHGSLNLGFRCVRGS